MTDIDPQADLEIRFADEHVTVKVPLWGRGGSLHPVIQAGRTADRSAVLSPVQNVNHTLAAADFGTVICHITLRRGCRRGDGLPRLRKGPRDFRVAAAQLGRRME